MAVIPRLAEVSCTKIHFDPGDRVVVRVFQPLEKEARRRLERTVQKWAGVSIEVLVVDATKYDVAVEKARPIIVPGSS